MARHPDREADSGGRGIDGTRKLPAAVAGEGWAYLGPRDLTRCWLDFCHELTDPNTRTGLCTEHLDELRTADTESTTTQTTPQGRPAQ